MQLDRILGMSLTADTAITQSAKADAVAWDGVERRARPRVLLALEHLAPEAWDRAAAKFDGVVQEQLYAYAKTRWPSAKPEAVVFSVDGEVIGGTLMMIQRLPLGLGAIAISKWGPIFKDATRSDAEAIYGSMIDALVEDYAVKRKMMLSVLPRAATSPSNWQYDHLIARGFHQGATLLFPNRYVVNLRLSDEAQRKSLHQKWRYHLNKSEKAGLTFEHAGIERAKEFDALYEAMTDRKNFPDHSAYNTIPALMGVDSVELRPELFFVRHEGEVVAGAIIFKAGDTAVYLFGATNDRALPLRAGYFMHWNIIRWLRDNTAAKWYDLGGTDGFQGLHQFKKGMVGDAGVITPVPPVANFATYKLPFILGTAAFAGREFAHRAQRQIDKLFGGKARPDQQRTASAEGE
jgi:lipid II:glycine glycyltransferase (peptidoglycan interpeptide bridge formation enzyme)